MPPRAHEEVVSDGEKQEFPDGDEAPDCGSPAESEKDCWEFGALLPGDHKRAGWELERLAEFGLGKGINATMEHPWADKKPFQAREVNRKDLAAINEGNRLDHYSEVTQNYYEMQGSIEASVTAPNMPIQSTVAADVNRSFTSSVRMEGTLIATRTIAFQLPTPSDQTSFEMQLHDWVKASGCTRSESPVCAASEECAIYDSTTTTSECKKFLITHGGITHFVSSITLGAMKYSIKTKKRVKLGASQKTALGVERLGNVEVDYAWEKLDKRETERDIHIGRIPEKDDGILRVRSTSEAVIKFSFSTLTSLVSNLSLKRHLEQAIQQYIQSTKKSKHSSCVLYICHIRHIIMLACLRSPNLHFSTYDCQLTAVTSFSFPGGPYHIVTAEPVAGIGDVYWKLSCNGEEKGAKLKYTVTGTASAQEAGAFHIRPDYDDKSGKWFLITTDHDEELYLHLTGQTTVEARLSLDKPTGRFKLVDRDTCKSCTLADSRWLPKREVTSDDAGHRPGKAYFIRPSHPSCNSLFNKKVLTINSEDPFEFAKKKCQEIQNNGHFFLFKLIKVRLS